MTLKEFIRIFDSDKIGEKIRDVLKKKVTSNNWERQKITMNDFKIIKGGGRKNSVSSQASESVLNQDSERMQKRKLHHRGSSMD